MEPARIEVAGEEIFHLGENNRFCEKQIVLYGNPVLTPRFACLLLAARQASCDKPPYGLKIIRLQPHKGTEA
jgi:hypothetical protein